MVLHGLKRQVDSERFKIISINRDIHDRSKQNEKNINVGLFDYPIREKSLKLIADPDHVIEVLDTGARKCKEIAGETMEEVRY